MTARLSISRWWPRFRTVVWSTVVAADGHPPDDDARANATVAPNPDPAAATPPVPVQELPVAVADQVAAANQETEGLLHDQRSGGLGVAGVDTLGEPLNRRSPFVIGFTAALGVLLAYGLVRLLLELTQIITFIVVALFLALGLEPLVARLMRAGLRRGWAVVVVMLSFVLVLAFIGWMIVPTFAEQIGALVNKTPGYVTHLQHNHLIEQLDHRFHVMDRIQNRAKSSINEGTITSVLGGVLGAGKALVDGVVGVVTVLVLTLYLMAALPSVKTAAYKLVPQKRRARVVYLGEEISRRVGGYVLGQVTIAVINGVLTYIMLIVLRLPFAAVLAVLAGFLALIPIVGTVVGGVIITLVALSAGWETALFALGYYIAYHVFEAYVLSPRIMHRAVDVPAVVVIIAVLAGGTLLGIIGALIAIPVAAGLSLIYDRVLVPRQQGSGSLSR
jgi:predicted PurR-regulated permease PerM